MNNLLKLIPFTGTQKKFYINDILSNTCRLFHRFDEIVKSFIKICTTGSFRKLVHFYNRTGNWQKYIVVEFFLVYLEKYMYLLFYYRGILKCINFFTNGIGIPIC